MKQYKFLVRYDEAGHTTTVVITATTQYDAQKIAEMQYGKDKVKASLGEVR